MALVLAVSELVASLACGTATHQDADQDMVQMEGGPQVPVMGVGELTFVNGFKSPPKY